MRCLTPQDGTGGDAALSGSELRRREGEPVCSDLTESPSVRNESLRLQSNHAQLRLKAVEMPQTSDAR
jgi:hypothetical protein